MDSESLPHFCKREGSGSSRDSLDGVDCYSYDHPFHQQLYNYMKQQSLNQYSAGPRKQGSVHVDVPSPGLEEVKIAETIKAELQNLRGSNGLTHSFNSIQIEGPWGRQAWEGAAPETVVQREALVILSPGTYAVVVIVPLACNYWLLAWSGRIQSVVENGILITVSKIVMVF